MAVVITLSKRQTLRLVCVLLLVTAIATSVASIAVQKWYHVGLDGVSDVYYGLFRMCTDMGSSGTYTCVSSQFADVTSGCARSGVTMRQRVQAIAGTSIASSICGAVALVMHILSKRVLWRQWVACAASTVSALLASFCVAWTAFIFHGWYYCSTDYCSWVRGLGFSQTCISEGGASWSLMIASMSLFVSALLCQSILLIGDLRQSVRTPSKLATSHDPMPSVSEWKKQSVALPQEVNAPTSATADRPRPPLRWPDFTGRKLNGDNVLPDGQWVFDSTCRLYWSNDEQLYVHLESGMFYDPHSGMWYDSDKREWLEP